VEPGDTVALTIDELASSTGTTTRRIRSFQTLGLVPYPELRGRTGVYGAAHRDRVAAIVRLQEQGFSLESLGILFDALETGRSLAMVLGVAAAAATPVTAAETPDTAELYGFTELQERTGRGPRRGAARPLLSVVPTTMWVEGEAS
jgi:DNA-binding transcriptional MerR regulator